MFTIETLLQFTIDKNASDLHVISGYYPTVRINNRLYPMQTTGVMSRELSERLLFSILTDEQKKDFIANKEIDFGYTFKTIRFRVNYYFERGSPAASFRLISPHIQSIEDLNLPKAMHDFAKYHDGLVLITGPTGEGKSTTLASILNEVNMNEAKHIITIEDPIEYIYPVGKSIISQRELDNDTHSWTKALRSILREDPDVVLIGEMRDFDTIQAALTIAETGHLVFSTLHTSTTPEAINRIIDVFPSNQQPQIRHQLASVLRAVVTQRLVPHINEKFRIPVVEILMSTPAVSSVIREGKIFMLDNIIETGEEQNMILLEKYLARLYHEGQISRDVALNYSERPNEVKKFVM